MRSLLIYLCLVLSIVTASPGFADARCGLFGGRQPVRSFIRAVFNRGSRTACSSCAAPSAKAPRKYECNGNSCRLVPVN